MMQNARTTPASGGHELSLRQLLSVPYRIEAETIERTPGLWVRRAAYPELTNCIAEGPTIVQTLEDLERRRIEWIVAAVRAGTLPPLPRRPLIDCDPEGLLHRFGLSEDLVPLLDYAASRLIDANAKRDLTEE